MKRFQKKLPSPTLRLTTTIAIFSTNRSTPFPSQNLHKSHHISKIPLQATCLATSRYANWPFLLAFFVSSSRRRKKKTKIIQKRRRQEKRTFDQTILLRWLFHFVRLWRIHRRDRERVFFIERCKPARRYLGCLVEEKAGGKAGAMVVHWPRVDGRRSLYDRYVIHALTHARNLSLRKRVNVCMRF